MIIINVRQDCCSSCFIIKFIKIATTSTPSRRLIHCSSISLLHFFLLFLFSLIFMPRSCGIIIIISSNNSIALILLIFMYQRQICTTLLNSLHLFSYFLSRYYNRVTTCTPYLLNIIILMWIIVQFWFHIRKIRWCYIIRFILYFWLEELIRRLLLEYIIIIWDHILLHLFICKRCSWVIMIKMCNHLIFI